MHDERHCRMKHRGGHTQNLAVSTSKVSMRATADRATNGHIRSINSEQLVTPTDRILVLGKPRRSDDQQRCPIAPAPDMERTEIVRRRPGLRWHLVFAMLLAAAFEIALQIAARVSHT